MKLNEALIDMIQEHTPGQTNPAAVLSAKLNFSRDRRHDVFARGAVGTGAEPFLDAHFTERRVAAVRYFKCQREILSVAENPFGF